MHITPAVSETPNIRGDRSLTLQGWKYNLNGLRCHVLFILVIKTALV